MASRVSYFLLFSSLSLLSIATAESAEERAPHGLARENPTAFSPSAYDFFHPTTQNPIANSPLPMAAQVQSTEAHQSKFSTSPNGQTRLGAGGIAGILFGLALVVFLAMGVFYVLVTRRENMRKANTVQPDV